MPELLTSVLYNSGTKISIGLVNWLLTSQKQLSWAREHCKIKGNLKQLLKSNWWWYAFAFQNMIYPAI